MWLPSKKVAFERPFAQGAPLEQAVLFRLLVLAGGVSATNKQCEGIAMPRCAD